VAGVNEVRPFPPGEYPVVVVGSGPGGLQTSYALSRLGIGHAAISQDDAPGGMFRRFPIFQRLLSWTKPDAPFPRESRQYEWFDHNSLVANEPECRAAVAAVMDRSFMVPSRPEMERGLADFATKAGVEIRYGCRWESTRREDDGRFTLVTSDGEYRCEAAIFAIGVTDPWKSAIPGIEDVPHYVETKAARDYHGRTVFVIGKRNSGFELADGLVPWARRVILGSPRPVQSAVLGTATVRVRYFQPLEDASWGGGTLALDAAIERIERTAAGFRIHAAGTTRPGEIVVDADDVIAATGFRTPLRDLTDLGVETVQQGRVPALTPFWESATVPGIYFAGNTMQGAPGLRRHGVSSASGTVVGFRYNAAILARHLAETRFGPEQPRPAVDQGELVPFLLRELTTGPELWAQKSYLARVVSAGDDGLRDEGVVPLAHFADSDMEGVAVTVEMNAEGAIYPATYVRTGGRLTESTSEPEHRDDYMGEPYRRWLDHLVRPLVR